jgi:gluconate 2-dehydrogenase alpha chain
VHWNAETWRFLPSDFVARTHLINRYGADFLPKDMTIQDWGITYDDLEPHYDRFEYLCGTSGQAGNVNGQIIEGGNPFEGPRSRPYPNPPQQQPFGATLFAKAARELGYKPFPQPSGNMSQPYRNPLGVRLGPCTYCGFCEWFGCGNYSKATPQTTILPALLRKQNFSLRDNSEVTRINLDASGKRATGVTFVDTDGNEWEQPADLVILSAYTIFNVQLLLLSGIGEPYDPIADTGTVGRNFTHQTISDVTSFFDPAKFVFNPFIASGAIGMCIDEFNGDNFDHGPHGFVGGGYMGQVQTNGRPIETTPVPPGTPAWGAEWKKAVKENYQSALKPGTGVHGSMYSYRDVYVDLDPTYKDRFGRPLARMTIDFHDNELRQNKFLTDKFAEIFKAMGAKQIKKEYRKGPYDITKYQTTHLCGGAIMGTVPGNSTLNRYLQSWDVPNLFVTGASAFPQNPGYNPTGTVAALAYWAADAIRSRYLKNPGRLIDA